MAVNLCPLPKYTHTQRNLFCIKIHKDKDNNDIKKKKLETLQTDGPLLVCALSGSAMSDSVWPHEL